MSFALLLHPCSIADTIIIINKSWNIQIHYTREVYTLNGNHAFNYCKLLLNGCVSIIHFFWIKCHSLEPRKPAPIPENTPPLSKRPL